MSEKTIILPPAANGNEAKYHLTVVAPKRRYWSYLRERWWATLFSIVVATGAMLTYETVRPETYTSFAQLYLSGDVQLNIGMFFTEDTVNYYGTQIELLKSARLQGAAFDRAGITLPPGKKNPFKVDVYQPMKTSILIVQVTGPEPLNVQKLLQALLQEYLSYKKDNRKSTTEDLVSSLTAELAKRETELKVEQDKWADFQKSNNMAVLEEQGKSAGRYLSDLNLQLDKLKLDRELLAQDTGIIAVPGTNEAGSPVSATMLPARNGGTNTPAAGTDLALNSAEVQLEVLLAERAQKTNELGQSHPAMRRLNDDIARLQKTVSVLAEQDLSQRKLEMVDLDRRIAAIRQSIPVLEAKVLSTDDLLSEGQRLKNNIQRQQGFYDHLLTMLQGVDLSKSVQQERLSILQDASPALHTERYLALRLALAGIAGLFFSLGSVFVWYLLDDRFVSVRDIKDQFGEPVLGLVPQVRRARSNPAGVLIEMNDPRTAYAEAYRHLRSALLLSSGAGGRPQTLLFTGAAQAEGKTTVAINLARVLARSGLTVTLVDVDTQTGGIHQLLGIGPEPGVLEYLRGEATRDEILRTTEIPGLKVVSTGAHSLSSEDLFVCSRLEELLSELRKDADFVILDSAPILAADDAALLVPHADAVVLVVRPFYTRSRAVRQALDMLYQRQAKRVAIVLNRARAEDFAGYYAQNGSRRATVNGKVRA